MNKINIVTLGCAKNVVDSEQLLRQIKLNGVTVEYDSLSVDSDVVIINTCGFINDAKKESVNTILQYVKAKKEGRITKLFVVGCLSEKYGNILKNEIPEVDKYLGINYIDEIISILKLNYYKDQLFERELTTPRHYAYLKISEGCNRKCSFCSIPSIRGKYLSKPEDFLFKEAEYLAERGVKEMILIAQDLSYYGLDTFGKQMLPQLIDKLSGIVGIEWIRLHYLYPSNFPVKLLKIIKDNSKVCKYLDIPFQHSSDKILKLMHRGIDHDKSQRLIDKIRKEIPGIALRTTILTGHPGETEKDFDDLRDFVIYNRFEKLGVFIYSHEENTYSYRHYKDSIPQRVKNARMDELMSLQKNISAEKNKSMVDKNIKILVDRENDSGFTGRTEFDSPEIDNEVIIKGNTSLKIGNFYNAKIIASRDYDLLAKVII